MTMLSIICLPGTKLLYVGEIRLCLTGFNLLVKVLVRISYPTLQRLMGLNCGNILGCGTLGIKVRRVWLIPAGRRLELKNEQA